MDHNLDYCVRLNPESEFKSLYQWSLNEIGDAGARVARAQVPWNWTCYFDVVELIASERLEFGRDNGFAFPGRNIKGRLRPSDHDGGGATRYSVLGTSRTINDFILNVVKVAPASDGDEDEETTHREGECFAWGSVSYTSEVDFRDDTTDDVVIFSLCVDEPTFERLYLAIAKGQVTGGTLQVGGVDGFYSDWSPSISTHHIKVLTGFEKDHPVEIPPGCGLVPPRLGKIREASFSFARKLPVLANNVSMDEAPLASPEKDTTPAFGMVTNAPTLKILGSIRLAGWLIVALLVLSLFR